MRLRFLSQETSDEILTLCGGGQLLRFFYAECTNATQVQ